MNDVNTIITNDIDNWKKFLIRIIYGD